MTLGIFAQILSSINIRGSIASDLLVLLWFVLFLYISGLNNTFLVKVDAFLKPWLGALLMGAFLFFPAAVLVEAMPYTYGLKAAAFFFLMGLLREAVKLLAVYLAAGFHPQGGHSPADKYIFPGILAGAGFAGMEGWVVLSGVLTAGGLQPLCLVMAFVQRFFLFSFQVAAPAIILMEWSKNRVRGVGILLAAASVNGLLVYYLPMFHQSHGYLNRGLVAFAVLAGFGASLYLIFLIKCLKITDGPGGGD